MTEFLLMIEPVVKVIHILASAILIVSILLQAGKGAGLGAAFGVGASQTLFGAQGSGHFLSRVTIVGALIFLMTSMSLALTAKEQSLGETGPSVIDDMKEEVPPAPAVPTQQE